MRIVQHELNKLPGLESLPSTLVPGYETPNEFVPKKLENYVFPIEVVRDVIGHLFSGTRFGLYLWGPQGSGKSSVIRQLCAWLNRPLFYISGHKSLEFEDLIATKEIIGGDTVAIDGPLLQAAQMPHATFLFEEVDRARSDVSVSLNPILDGYDIVHTLDGGRLVRPADGFQVVFTANTNGSGDMTGDFNSAVAMDRSFLDRVWMTEVPYLPPDVEFDIIRRSVGADVVDEQIRRSISWANDVRYLHTQKHSELSSTAQKLNLSAMLETAPSTRTLCELWRALGIFPGVDQPIDYALRRILTNKCMPESAEAIHKLAEAHFAGD